MWEDFPLKPPQASTFAERVDMLYYFITGVSIFFGALIFILVIVFAIKYRRRSETEVPKPVHGSLALELTWSIIPFCLAMTMFGWGALIYFDMYHRAPESALEISVIGKQWMWHFQHPTGQREINTLHIPTGRPIRLTMATEDVIHSLYIPAFRVKKDLVPGRYTTLWFEATQPGTYHLFCAEYCGTKHSQMGGSVIAMEPAQYQQWLAGVGAPAEAAPGDQMAAVLPAEAGQKLFRQLNCHTCHMAGPGGQGPNLIGIFGQRVTLQNGETVTVDEAYIRESILMPRAKVVLGYPAAMPTYQGQVNEQQIMQLIAYIKSLK